jgi:hypothetical protein
LFRLGRFRRVLLAKQTREPTLCAMCNAHQASQVVFDPFKQPGIGVEFGKGAKSKKIDAVFRRTALFRFQRTCRWDSITKLNVPVDPPSCAPRARLLILLSQHKMPMACNGRVNSQDDVGGRVRGVPARGVARRLQGLPEGHRLQALLRRPTTIPRQRLPTRPRSSSLSRLPCQRVLPASPSLSGRSRRSTLFPTTSTGTADTTTSFVGAGA